MTGLISNIISYLKYLNSDCDLRVSVHFDNHTLNTMPQDILSQLLPFNYHTNAYCLLAKNADHIKCIANQESIIKKAHNHEAFCNQCHAGVYEYIYPVCNDGCAVGFISVSGYRQKIPEDCNILNYDLWESVLKDNIPQDLCNCVIPPLSVMIEQLLNSHTKKSDNEYSQLLQFLNEYHTNIALDDLAKHFGRSRSHISHLFKKESGITIRAYCNNLKLADAKKLLENTDLPITEIAFNVGFNDTSYFISLFRSSFSITPFQYRQLKKDM